MMRHRHGLEWRCGICRISCLHYALPLRAMPPPGGWTTRRRPWLACARSIPRGPSPILLMYWDLTVQKSSRGTQKACAKPACRSDQHGRSRRGDPMRRREFVRFLASGAAVQLVAGAASGQEVGRSYRLACLVQAHRNAPNWIAFFEELRKNGFVEGVNLSIVDGFNAPLDRAETIATALVGARPDAIMTAGALTKVVQRATQTIPILTVSDDLLAEQAVASLAHPGGNTTGISIFGHRTRRQAPGNSPGSGPPRSSPCTPRRPGRDRTAPARCAAGYREGPRDHGIRPQS